MSINHGNLFNDLVILVWGRYVVLHVTMNITGVGVGVGDRDGTTSGGKGRVCDKIG